MKKKFKLIFWGLIFTIPVFAQNCYVFIGTYNSGKSKPGIYVYDLDTTSGNLKEISVVKNIFHPSYLTISLSGKFVFACTDTKTANAGSMTGFEFDTTTKKLTPTNSQRSGGENPVYVSLDKSERWLINANYTGGSASVFNISVGGKISPAIQVIEYDDSSINKVRQEHSHIHSAVFSPNEDYVFFPDLGADKIRIYKFDTLQKQPFQKAPVPFVKTVLGSGPRHIIFNPNGRFAYCTEEMGGTVSIYKYNKGTIKRIQRINTHTKRFIGNYKTADIHISPDAQFLYVSNRGDENNIAIFSIREDGTLKTIGYEPTDGVEPRNFAISPKGKFLIVANEISGNIVVFKRNAVTGLLQRTNVEIKINNPSCVKIRQY